MNEGYFIVHETTVVPDLATGPLSWLPDSDRVRLRSQLTKRTYINTGHVANLFGEGWPKERAEEEARNMTQSILTEADAHPKPRTTVCFRAVTRAEYQKIFR